MARWVLLLATLPLLGQTPEDWKKVLDRLDRLERENHDLKEELRSLTVRVTGVPPAETKEEVAGVPVDSTSAVPEVPLAEKVAIQDRRIAEQAETKVESSQRFPIRVTGMALFNASYGTKNSAGNDILTRAAPEAGRATGGGTFRQSVIGLEYYGPRTFLGGKVKGSVFLDFFDGLAEEGDLPLRLRTANVELEWKTRTIGVGLEKAIFNPREPTSLAQVGISPMTGAGNLWRWQPQIRFEQRFRLGENTEFRAQGGFLQTFESAGYEADATPESLERRRPSVEGRFELAHHFDETHRLEFAPGFHYSTTHVAGASIPSKLVSLDWFFNPWSRLEFTGAFFHGQNVAHFGALRQGFQILRGQATAVRATGGWGQFAFRATPKLTFHLIGGIHDDKDSDLRYSERIGQNRIGTVNLMYRLAPNVIWSLEAMQARTNYLGNGWRLVNRYDMAVAYQF